jgi:F420H(2)-dependent quinone reductase
MKAETFFYLVTRGRNSGLPRRIEIWFVELNGLFYLLAESRDRDWFKNIVANASVVFTIGNRRDESSEMRETEGAGRIIDEALENDLCARVRGLMHAKYRWTSGLLVEIAPR